VTDPLGGINTLWPLFGIGNQMLASMALLLGTVVLFKMKKERYAWITIVPTTLLFITSMTAGYQKIFHTNPKIGFLAQAQRFNDAIAQGKILAPAKTIEEMQRVAFANQINAVLCGFFMLVAIVMLVAVIINVRKALANSKPTVRESEAVYRDAKKEVTHA
jgi:carbon starvation protein